MHDPSYIAARLLEVLLPTYYLMAGVSYCPEQRLGECVWLMLRIECPVNVE